MSACPLLENIMINSEWYTIIFLAALTQKTCDYIVPYNEWTALYLGEKEHSFKRASRLSVCTSQDRRWVTCSAASCQLYKEKNAVQWHHHLHPPTAQVQIKEKKAAIHLWPRHWNGKLRILSSSPINLLFFTSIFCSYNSCHHLSFWVWKPSSCNACCSHSRWSWWLHAVAYYSHYPLHALLW